MHKHKLRQNTNQIEVRTHPEEIRVGLDTQGNRTVSGYAVMWNQPFTDLGFIEKVAPYAFRDSIAANDTRLLREHKPESLLARTSSKTLTLSEDANGLQFSATLPNSPIGQDTAELITRSDLKGMSFGPSHFRYLGQRR